MRASLVSMFALLSACSDRTPTPAALPLARSAELSVSATLDSIACSTSVSCSMRRPPHGEPSALVRVNLVCRGAKDERVTLLRAPLSLDCDGQTTTLELPPEAGHLAKRGHPPPGRTITQVTTYLGADLTPCEGGQCESRYWNLGLELSREAFASRRCALTTSMTALMNDARRTSHPVIDVALDVIQNQRLVCSQHSLGKPGSGVTVRQTEDLAPYTRRFPPAP